MQANSVKPKDVLSLLHKQQFRCAYTGDPLTPENTGADHQVPVSRGGTHALDNIVLVTQAVNSAKGAMMLDEFVSMCMKVAEKMGRRGLESPIVIPSPGELSGLSDPIEILTTLGYVDAANDVVSLRERVRSLERTDRKAGRKISLDEYTEERKAKLASLEQDIKLLQIKRSQLRSQTGWSKDAVAVGA